MSQEFSHKNLLLTSPSRAFGCVQRYIQGPGELGHVFDYGKKYGDKFLFIIDSGVFDMIKGKIEAIEDKNGCSWMYESYFGECCKENVEALTAVVKQSGCNVVCGVGGGKVLDTVKLVADAADVARIILPTSASSDAPAADWAAVYDINGVHLGGVPTKRSTELVLVDSAIIATAPARLFAAGIADALVTWFEAVANEKAGTPNWIGRGYVISRAGMAIAKECYEVLVSEGKRAYEAVKVKALTPAVEDVIEANVLLSGLGFMNAGCAGAHGVHNGISEIEAGNAYLHGEKVTFGLGLRTRARERRRRAHQQHVGADAQHRSSYHHGAVRHRVQRRKPRHNRGAYRLQKRAYPQRTSRHYARCRPKRHHCSKQHWSQLPEQQKINRAFQMQPASRKKAGRRFLLNGNEQYMQIRARTSSWARHAAAGLQICILEAIICGNWL